MRASRRSIVYSSSRYLYSNHATKESVVLTRDAERPTSPRGCDSKDMRPSSWSKAHTRMCASMEMPCETLEPRSTRCMLSLRQVKIQQHPHVPLHRLRPQAGRTVQYSRVPPGSSPGDSAPDFPLSSLPPSHVLQGTDPVSSSSSSSSSSSVVFVFPSSLFLYPPPRTTQEQRHSRDAHSALYCSVWHQKQTAAAHKQVGCMQQLT